MKTTLHNQPRQVCLSTFLLLASIGLVIHSSKGATTYRLADYFYPLTQGNVWIYTDPSGGGGDMLRRVDSAATLITCYSGGSNPRTYTVSAAAIYGAYGTSTGGSGFSPSSDPTDLWIEYVAPGTTWGIYGGDQHSDNGSVWTTRVDPAWLIVSPVAVGQTIAFNSDYYSAGTYQTAMSMTFKLIDTSTIAVPNGTYTNCLHVLYFTTSSAHKGFTNEEWWAFGLGPVKRIHNGGAVELVYSSVVPPPQTPPTITSQPADSTNVVGTTAVFSVAATGAVPMSYLWRRNGNLISGGSYSAYTNVNVKLTDSGSLFSCQVMNTYGAALSSNAVLTVTPPPPQLAPTAMAGDAFLAEIDSGTYPPLADHGYLLLLPANSGGGCQVVGIENVADDTGTYTYTKTGASAAQIGLQLITAKTSSQIDFSFVDASSGSYDLETTSPSGYSQAGRFLLAAGSAPSAVGGKRFSCQVTAGQSPFNGSGSYSILFSTAGNAYQLTGSAGVQDSSGTFSVSSVNRSTLAVRMNDSIIGQFTVFVGFTDNMLSGGFAARASSGGFQVGKFSIVDSISPTLSISFPGSGQQFTNDQVTITGTASDNAAVAAVWCQVGSGPWVQAAGTNNWSASLTLAPGTNIVSAYAADTSGNLSRTSSVPFIFFDSPLALQFVGQGAVQISGPGGYNSSVSSNTNLWLIPGRSYRATASTPKTGFGFTGWNGSVTSTNNPLTFTMRAGFTLTAKFGDTQPPACAITSPAANAPLTNAACTVTGTASDNAAVAAVWCAAGSGAWVQATGTNNWSAGLTLLPGTNGLRAYAVDTSGNVSGTKSSVVILDTLFPLQIAGQGTAQVTGGGLTGTYSRSTNLWLIPGASYAFKATAASGFGLAGWSGSLASTNTTVTLTMAPGLGLTATFVDVTPPTVTVTAPANGAQFTNASCTMTGTASDNVAVASVWGQVGTTAWGQATGTNTWTAALTLAPGTNIVRVYAADAAGNHSAMKTNLLVLKAPLPIHIAGVGTVQVSGGSFSQSFSSDAAPWLVPGQLYSVKAQAVATSGFTFTNWSGSLGGTNWSANLTMAAGQAIGATFVDTQAPSCAITYPAVNAQLTDTVITVTGGAKDNVGVTNVWCALNGTNWLTVITTNNYTNWTATASLPLGSNTVAACAADAAGHLSRTNTVKFVCKPTKSR